MKEDKDKFPQIKAFKNAFDVSDEENVKHLHKWFKQMSDYLMERIPKCRTCKQNIQGVPKYTQF